MLRKLPLLLLFFVVCVHAEENGQGVPAPVLQQILERLEHLEQQNRQLIEEVRQLREQATASTAAGLPAAGAQLQPAAEPPQPSLEERLSVQERRTAEQAQSKVEAAHKLPIQINGMLLFNAFSNTGTPATRGSNEAYGLLTGPNSSGATLRQTLLGLKFEGPRLPGNGRIGGSLMMDFWGGTSDPALNWLRIRRADISLDWKNRSFSFRQDKPLISPYQPDSLAQVGVPPLAGAGNLWAWLPQVRYEERVRIGQNAGITGQVALLQTKETFADVPNALADTLEPTRPALEGRFAFWYRFSDTARIEVAPGFHVSSTHVGGTSVGSQIGSLDWMVAAGSHLQVSGAAFKGQNVSSLGALTNAFTRSPDGRIRPVDSSGGWTQFSVPITNRLTINLFGGLQSDAGVNIDPSYTVRNFSYASNLMYHLGSNVIVSVEAMQSRLRSGAGATQLQNHYDLAVGYLF